MSGRISIRQKPVSADYSARYQVDLIRATKSVEADRVAGLPLAQLVWRARTAYAACWARELERDA